MAHIDTLVDDIYSLLSEGKVISDESADAFGKEIAQLIKDELHPDKRKKEKAVLRMSNFGTRCDRKLWYDINEPEDGEDLKPNTLFVFLYGHIIDRLIPFLIKETDHKIEGLQDTVDVEGVPGHMDCIIDGVLVDVKSANSRSFEKFEKHKLEQDDPFGYLDQLRLYLEAGQNDDRITNKNEAAFLAVDKERGRLCLDTYKRVEPSARIRERVQEKGKMVASPDVPLRGFHPVPHNKSGNLQLDLPCRYCRHKSKCWPSLRTFIYSSGPVFLTHVAKVPEVPEVRGNVDDEDN